METKTTPKFNLTPRLFRKATHCNPCNFSKCFDEKSICIEICPKCGYLRKHSPFAKMEVNGITLQTVYENSPGVRIERCFLGQSLLIFEIHPDQCKPCLDRKERYARMRKIELIHTMKKIAHNKYWWNDP